MDTSEQYIKMCEKAEEVQEQKQFLMGDYLTYQDMVLLVRHPDESGDCLLVQTIPRGYTYYVLPSTLIHCIWLPRQDQLQEMVFNISGTYNLLGTKLFAFSDYWTEHGIPIEFTSMEQLWLAFVMKERYNKVWNGEEWVEDNAIL